MENNIQSLILQWKDRLSSTKHSTDYRIGVEECILDLQSYLTVEAQRTFLLVPTEEIKQYFLDQEADTYLSSIEAHEQPVW